MRPTDAGSRDKAPLKNRLPSTRTSGSMPSSKALEMSRPLIVRSLAGLPVPSTTCNASTSQPAYLQQAEIPTRPTNRRIDYYVEERLLGTVARRPWAWTILGISVKL